MERLTYILDTNAIADYISQFEPTVTHIKQAFLEGHVLHLCQPVQYEVARGLLKTNATRKRRIFEESFVPLMTPLELIADDWDQAARFWADTTNRGYQLSDIDLLVAALATRLNSIIVSNDDDFDALPVRRANWRNTL